MTPRSGPPLRTAVAVTAALLLAAPTPALARRTATTPGFDGPTKRIRTTAPATPAPTPPLTLAPSGDHPHAIVDGAGTAYVTWTANGAGPGGEDAIGFCRIPRAASGCDNPPATRLLVPQKGYDSGDSPSANLELSRGALPVILGQQLAIVSTRYPTRYPLPGGGESDTTTILYVSDDGGTSFSGGAPTATGLVADGEAVAFGSESAPRIGVLSGPRGDGIDFQAIAPGSFTTAVARLADGVSGADAQLTALPDGGLAAVFGTGPGRFGVRRLPAGAANPNDAASWSPTESFSGYDPSIAAGPGGALYVTSREFSDLGVYRVRRVGGGDLGPLHPQTLASARIAGGGGALTAAYLDPGGTRDAVKGHVGLSVRRSAAGDGRFGAEQRITTTADVHELSFQAAPDGGGFAVWRTSDAGAGPIRGHFLGRLGRSALPGLPTTAPGAGSDVPVSSSCRSRRFGKVTLTVESGCFLSGKRDGRTVAVAEGPLTLNGLRITPLGSTQLVFDPSDRELYTSGSGSARVEIPSASGSIVLWQGGLRQKLGSGNGQRLLNFDGNAFKVTVKGLPAVGAIEPLIDGDGVRIPLALALPTVFGDITGQATLRVSADAGLDLQSLDLRAPSIVVPPIEISDLRLSWRAEGDRWQGGATIALPGGASLTTEVAVAGRKLVSIRASYFPTFPGIAVYPQVYLHRVDAGIGFGPLRLSGGAGVGAFPLLPPSHAGTSGTYLVDLNGSLTAVFGDPFVLRATGDLSILSTLDVAHAGFEFSTAGYARFKGRLGAFEATRPFAYLGVETSLYVGSGGIQGKAAGEACGLGKCVKLAEIVASQKGMGGCGTIPLPTWDPPFVELATGSVTYEWGDLLPEFDSGCDLSNVTIAGARQAGAPHRFAVPAGAKRATINLRGEGGVPAVDLIDPAGRTVAPEAEGDRIATGASEPTRSRVIVLGDPAAGSWQVVPRAGSPAVTRIRASVPARAPKLRATVGRARKGSRTIRYRLDAVPDESVSFVERTARGTVPLRGGGRRGTVRFRPNPLVPGRHVIEAQISQGGIVKHTRVVGRFVQPRLRVGVARQLRVRRRGSRLEVRFRAAGSGLRHAVLVRYGDGARTVVVLPAGRTVARLRAPRRVVRPRRTTVTVRALSPAGRYGRAARAGLRR
ncbi:hypothetical protein [Patulibacter defluvii]|uniref:hypothetical protein n=1 Tax=Patulibacter defluvii TaxID=3095358 RepID=UPI002A74D8B8|nr:hypothetical protein [Patulibacter sp. DM4]